MIGTEAVIERRLKGGDQIVRQPVEESDGVRDHELTGIGKLHPPHQRIGAVLGLLSAIALLCGGYLSMRDEGISEQDAPAEIPTVKLQ